VIRAWPFAEDPVLQRQGHSLDSQRAGGNWLDRVSQGDRYWSRIKHTHTHTHHNSTFSHTGTLIHSNSNQGCKLGDAKRRARGCLMK